MPRIRRRRTVIKLITFGSAGLAVAVCLAVTGFWMSYGLRMNIEYSYQRSLSDLSDQMKNLSMDLQKAEYAGTTPQISALAGRIRSEALAAKTDLSQIAISDVNFDKTQKFIAQTGDYADSLARSITQQNKLSQTDRDTIAMLYTNSQKLSQHLDDIVADVQNGRLTLFKSDDAVGNLAKVKTKKVSAVASGFQNIEDNMSGIPSIIYDGPFSDNVLKKQPNYTKGKAAVSRATAKKAAAVFLGKKLKDVKDYGSTAGNLPTYNFKCGTKSVYVSKNGGIVVRMLDSRGPSSSKITNAAALQKASSFIKNRKLGSMKITYNLTGRNICTVNFAYMQGNVICYPDLVKAGVALDNGEIISYDATGFIMNHNTRSLPKVMITLAKAKSQLNPALNVKKVSLAVIPRNGTGEMLCYEFKCTGNISKKSSQNVIDYVNAQNAVEEQILILTNTPGGVLAM